MENQQEAPVSPAPSPWLAVGEALAVLGGCMATILLVGGVQVFLLAPRVHQATFDLVQATGRRAEPLAEVERRISALGLAEHVDIRGSDEAPKLVLRGLVSPDTVGDPVHATLAEAGYEMLPFQERSWPDVDPALLLERHPRWLLGAQSAVLLAFGAGFAALRLRPRAFAVPSRRSRALLFGFATGLGAFLASGALALLQSALGWKVEEQTWVVDLLRTDGRVLELAPWLVFVAPVAEEVFFRGYFFRFLHERAGARIAFPLSAACFSLIHFHLPGLVIYFVVGLLFAWVCRRTSTLVAPIAAHVTYNGIALAMALLFR